MKLYEIMSLTQVRYVELEITDFDGDLTYRFFDFDKRSDGEAVHRFDHYKVIRIEVGIYADSRDSSENGPMLSIAIIEPAPDGVFAR